MTDLVGPLIAQSFLSRRLLGRAHRFATRSLELTMPSRGAGLLLTVMAPQPNINGLVPTQNWGQAGLVCLWIANLD